jgi:carbon storage regulator CsrA
MLVLTRRAGEQIVIGNGIRVTVVSVGPGRVKLGIEAPPDVRVDRQEIHEKILQERVTGSTVQTAARPELPPEDAAPLVVNGTADEPKLYNRIADKLLATEPANGAVAAPAARLLRHRLPRKPR